ncbi:RNA-binding protein 45-like isoform X1 [Penaeus chinensis]|uniref:RNA-binding protein 45-like isoform X1 n=1 Tax=Penaeus chinensis TaxID=139456 RepID=UPI001FB77CCA|nr:RNA-binding protein 45-like isoform X1 [Penaeus chinensis]XP_047497073.1 RNA-binding protein 45-like isoform X1 [Penaeus chinensis]
MANTDKIFSRRYESSSREPRDNFHGSDGGKYGKESKYDDPPHSRLFIVCGKSITEEDFRESFSKYGTIEEIWVVKDRNTDEPKGVTYIKFSKTSEAALAMEEMNGKCIGGHPRPLKVLIAHSREQGSRRDMNEEERLLRLFVVVPKSLGEAELREHFVQFGDIDYVSIVRDRNTRDSKGFAYVKYHRMSHAAKAFESCERTFKPVFADPKPQKSDGIKFEGGGRDLRDLRGSESYGGGYSSGPLTPHHNNHHSPFDAISYSELDTSGLNPEGVTRLTVIASPTLNQDQLWKLFDLIPGLDYCDLRKDRKSGQMIHHQARGVATVVYNNIQSATYAKEKLHGFEYPPGQRLIVKLDHHDMPPGPPPMMPGTPGGPPFAGLPRVAGALASHNGTMGGSPPGGMAVAPQSAVSGGQPNSNIQQNLAQLAETIAQATSLIQAAGLNQGSAGHNNMGTQGQTGGGETYDPSYCSVKLPPPQPLAPVDSAVAERLFIVCHPSPPPIYALKDVFGRFGNLIDIYMLNGKTFGYAKYASKDSADKAIVVLHGQEVLGSRLKVMEADPHDKADSGRKRLRIDDQS